MLLFCQPVRRNQYDRKVAGSNWKGAIVWKTRQDAREDLRQMQFELEAIIGWDAVDEELFSDLVEWDTLVVQVEDGTWCPQYAAVIRALDGHGYGVEADQWLRERGHVNRATGEWIPTMYAHPEVQQAPRSDA